MNILYILGNGFDKAQGMATSYPEFYKYLEENVKNGISNMISAKIESVNIHVLGVDFSREESNKN